MRQLLRLRSLWLGLPVLLFLLWAWHRSSVQAASAFLSLGPRREWVESARSSITVKHIPGGPYPSEWETEISQQPLPPGRKRDLFPTALSATGATAPDAAGDIDPPTLRVAYWLLVLLYVSLWLGLVGLRLLHRRKLAPR